MISTIGSSWNKHDTARSELSKNLCCNNTNKSKTNATPIIVMNTNLYFISATKETANRSQLFKNDSIIPTTFIIFNVEQEQINQMNDTLSFSHSEYYDKSDFFFINKQKQIIDLCRYYRFKRNSIELANTLMHYIRYTMDKQFLMSSDFMLTPMDIDNIVGHINSNIAISTTNSYMMSTSLDQHTDSVVGVAFQSNDSGQKIRSSDQYHIIHSNISAGATISSDSLMDVKRLSMLVIDKPRFYHRFTYSKKEIILSSIIVAKIQRKPTSSFHRMNISLFFTKQFSPILEKTFTGAYVCSFYNPSTSNWDESGCTLPIYNLKYDRYECNCNHLTTFALLYRVDHNTTTTFSTTTSSSTTTTGSTTTSSSTTATGSNTTSSSTTTTDSTTAIYSTAITPPTSITDSATTTDFTTTADSTTTSDFPITSDSTTTTLPTLITDSARTTDSTTTTDLTITSDSTTTTPPTSITDSATTTDFTTTADSTTTTDFPITSDSTTTTPRTSITDSATTTDFTITNDSTTTTPPTSITDSTAAIYSITTAHPTSTTDSATTSTPTPITDSTAAIYSITTAHPTSISDSTPTTSPITTSASTTIVSATMTSIPTRQTSLLTAAMDTTAESALTTEKTTTSTSTSMISPTAMSTTSISSTTLSGTTTPPAVCNITIYNTSSCNNESLVQWFNCSCVSREFAQNTTVNCFRNLTDDTHSLCDNKSALLLTIYYASIKQPFPSSNTSRLLKPDEIENILNGFKNDCIISAAETFIISQLTNKFNNSIIGATFEDHYASRIIVGSTETGGLNNSVVAAAFVHHTSMTNSIKLNMLIRSNPFDYQSFTNRTDEQIVAPVIVMSVQDTSIYNVNVSLRFRPNNTLRLMSHNFSCAYYDVNTSTWNESGCTLATENTTTNLYECSCRISTVSVNTTPTINGTLIVVYNASKCENPAEIPDDTGKCDKVNNVQNRTAEEIRNDLGMNSTSLALRLTAYYASVIRSNSSELLRNRLDISLIDKRIGNLSGDFGLNSSTSFIMSVPPKRGNDSVIGAWFISQSGGGIIFDSNMSRSLSMSFSAAAIIENNYLDNIKSLNMFLLEQPNDTRLFNDSMNRTIASPIIIANPVRNSNDSLRITLYFAHPQDNLKNASTQDFYCVYFDTSTSSWEQNGCSKPDYNQTNQRYTCHCDHFTSFGLIWLPPGPADHSLRAVDICSLISQCISIVLLIAIIVHTSITNIRDPHIQFQAIDLLPLVSYASTALLFIFYIALTLTVYKSTPSLDTSKCFPSASVLMFFVYFFLLFMFCTKTSIGYFNYTHFVLLFPPPSFKKLNILLILSLISSMTGIAIAIGLNSNLSYNITALYRNKICWFTRDVIHYFMTIPILIFLAINIWLFLRIVKRMIDHARNATSPHQTYQRMKTCVLLLITSSITQGIGWIVGILIVFADSNTAAAVFEWIFVICNALEGVWLFLLYLIIRMRHTDEKKRAIAAKNLSLKRRSIIKTRKQINNDSSQISNNSRNRKGEIIHRFPPIEFYWL